MVLVKEKNIELSIGKAVGHVLEDELVATKKRLWVVSPWLSEKYAKFLERKKQNGVDVKLITTNDYNNLQHLNSLKYLIKVGYEPLFHSLDTPTIKLVLGAILFLSFFTLLISPLSLFLIAFILFLLGASFVKKIIYYSNISLTIIDRYADFTHSKLYILDDEAIIGSANLTESGLWKNWESLVIIKRKDLIKKLVDVFKSLEKHPMKERISIQEVGKLIHQESDITFSFER